MKSFKVLGELVLVEQILEKEVSVQQVGVFKGFVEILRFGEEVKDTKTLSVGDKVLIREHCLYVCPYTKESYIHLEQIVRTYD
jgi:hypothetical protein